MGEVEKDIIRLLEDNPGLSDRELAETILGHGTSPQYINQNCNALKTRGILYRKKREDGLIGNWLKKNNLSLELTRQVELEAKADEVSEKRLKQILEEYLISQRWEPRITWGISDHGVDIEARRGDQRWVIQVKGSGSLRPALIHNFLSVLGEVMQRMDDPNCKYSVALPDLDPFRRFWERLPCLAKSRMHITALFVNPEGYIIEEV